MFDSAPPKKKPGFHLKVESFLEKYKSESEGSRTPISCNREALLELTQNSEKILELILSSLLSIIDNKRNNSAYLNPNGFVSLDLANNNQRQTYLSLHIYDPARSVAEGIINDLPHNHRYDFSSIMLIGQINHQIYKKTNDLVANHTEYYYPKRKNSNSSFKHQPLGLAHLESKKLLRVEAGDIISLHNKVIHSVSYPIPKLTATLVLKKESGKSGNYIYKPIVESESQEDTVSAPSISLADLTNIILQLVKKISPQEISCSIRPIFQAKSTTSEQLNDYTLQNPHQLIEHGVPKKNFDSYRKISLSEFDNLNLEQEIRKNGSFVCENNLYTYNQWGKIKVVDTEKAKRETDLRLNFLPDILNDIDNYLKIQEINPKNLNLAIRGSIVEGLCTQKSDIDLVFCPTIRPNGFESIINSLNEQLKNRYPFQINIEEIVL